MIEVPVTPPNLSPTRQRPFESPFSDYFTDPSRSPEPTRPGPAQKSILHRLDIICEQIQRRELSQAAASLLHGNLDALEALLTAPESQSRQPADLGDSGLFLEDDGNEDLALTKDMRMTAFDRASACNCSSSPDGTAGRLHRGGEKLLKEAQAVLARVTESSRELRKRYEEVKRYNDQVRLKLESTANQVLQLRSHNESLRADLSFDHSELLYLRLQLSSLEAQASSFANQMVMPDWHGFLEGLEQWKVDWNDVDNRLRDRRTNCDALSQIVDHCGLEGYAQDLDLSEPDSTAASYRNASHPETQPADSQIAREDPATANPGQPANLQYLLCSRCRNSVSAWQLPGIALKVPSGRPKQEPRERSYCWRVPGLSNSVCSSPANDTNVTCPRAQLWDDLASLAGIYDYYD